MSRKTTTETVLSPEDPAIEPPLPHVPYKSTALRSPDQPLIALPPTPTETSGPTELWSDMRADTIVDLTACHEGAPIGQRIIISGRVLDERRRPIPEALVEIWQANAAGRYAHGNDEWDAP